MLQMLCGAQNYLVVVFGGFARGLSHIDTALWLELLADRPMLGIPQPVLVDKRPGSDMVIAAYDIDDDAHRDDLINSFARLAWGQDVYLARMAHVLRHQFDQSAPGTLTLAIRTGGGWLRRSSLGLRTAHVQGRLQMFVPVLPPRFHGMYVKVSLSYPFRFPFSVGWC